MTFYRLLCTLGVMRDVAVRAASVNTQKDMTLGVLQKEIKRLQKDINIVIPERYCWISGFYHFSVPCFREPPGAMDVPIEWLELYGSERSRGRREFFRTCASQT